MSAPMQRLKDLVARLLARPDEIMLTLGAGGELLVARLRAVLSLLILAMPLIAAAGGAKSSEVLIGLGLAVFANLMAQIWLALARRPRRYGWLPYATGTYDISLTTARPGAARAGRSGVRHEQHRRLVLLPDRHRDDGAAQRRPPHPVRQRAGDRAVRAAGRRDLRPRAGTGKPGVDRLRHRHRSQRRSSASC